MCLQCDVNAQLVCSNITKDFHLYVSAVEDQDWSTDCYGLVYVNDPTLVVGPKDEVIVFFCFTWLRKLLNQLHEARYDPMEYTVFDWLTERSEFYKLFEGIINNEKNVE